jgi:parvulin-like peptidyl-prolyl isomerase
VEANRGQSRRSSQPARAAGRQRLWLILFGLLLVLLFVGFAVAQGIGAPSVPSDSVAVVEDVPGDVGDITQEEFDRALVQQAAQQKLNEAPEPGDPQYEELKETALEELLNSVWLEAEAEELGVTVTDSQVEKELEKIKQQNFPTPKAFQKFLKESKLTEDEVDDRVRLQVLSTGIQEKVNEEAPEATEAEIADYYQAEKAAKFTTKESRDVRVIANEDKSEVVAAQKILEKDNSPASWEKVAAKYSTDATAKDKGGLQTGVQEEFLPPQLKGPIFDAATGELIGPIKLENNYLLLEVAKLVAAKTKSLAEVEGEISSILAQETQQDYFSEFVSDFQAKWDARTFCADGFVVETCANFVGSGHPANAPAACYEEDPAAPTNECPAPVTQTQPALPGSVTEAEPKGKPFVQRPLPEASEEQGTVVPEGAPSPEGAPPPEGAAPESGGAAPPGE